MSVGFLFDNDGVLIDSSAFHWRSWQLLMEEEPAFSMDYEQFKRGFGKRNDLILKEAAPTLSLAQHKKLARRKEELFRECARGKVTLLPGMELFLKVVKEAHIPRIIASSTPIENLQMFLKATVLGNYFEQCISAEEVAHGKPHPAIFQKAAERLQKEPRDCVVFEDAPAGIAAGRAAGCFVVALATTHSPETLTDYDLLVSSPFDLNLQEILQAHKVWKT